MSIVLDRSAGDLFRVWINKEQQLSDEKQHVTAGAYFLLVRVASAVYSSVRVLFSAVIVPYEIAVSLYRFFSSHPRTLHARYSFVSIPLTIAFSALTIIRSVVGIFFAKAMWGDSTICRWFNKKYTVVEFLQQTHYDICQPEGEINQWLTQTWPKVGEYVKKHNLPEFPLQEQAGEDFFQTVLPLIKQWIEIFSDEQLHELKGSVPAICLSSFYLHLLLRLDVYKERNPEQVRDRPLQQLRKTMKLEVSNYDRLQVAYKALIIAYENNAIIKQMLKKQGTANPGSYTPRIQAAR